MKIEKDKKVLIIGAGVFGSSTAYHLLCRGFMDVTVIDRGAVLPAQDAASADLNKVVRSSYSDIFYARLAREAIELWKNKEEWGDIYHESGVLVLGIGDTLYADGSYQNDVSVGARVERINPEHRESALRTIFPDGVTLGSFIKSRDGYFNRDGGWASASEGVARMLEKVKALGGVILPGKAVSKLLRENGRTSGVVCSDGSVITAELVVIATGAWTASLCPELKLGQRCLATGQSLATIQLTPEEGDRYRDCPVILDFQSGFYIFPPKADNVLKFAVHSSGYVHYTSDLPDKVSTPRTVTSHGKDGLRIPKTMVGALRGHLLEVYPDLAMKPFETRLCWYTDAPDGDWVIGSQSADPSLVLATAGSGHAYKFLPVIGRLVADYIEGTLDPTLAMKFSPERKFTGVDHSRDNIAPNELTEESLCSPGDLLP